MSEKHYTRVQEAKQAGWSHCVKISYESAGDASKAMRAVHRRFNGSTGKRGKVSVYRCPACNKFHWGHKGDIP